MHWRDFQWGILTSIPISKNAVVSDPVTATVDNSRSVLFLVPKLVKTVGRWN
jgi:hypothetical protein